MVCQFMIEETDEDRKHKVVYSILRPTSHHLFREQNSAKAFTIHIHQLQS